jgi:hypothetical protein
MVNFAFKSSEITLISGPMNISFPSLKNLCHIFAMGSMLMIAGNVYASSPHNEKIKTPAIEYNESNIETDTIQTSDPIHIRLMDPGFDVRFRRGTIRPWHDTGSPYLRRTIPVYQLV